MRGGTVLRDAVHGDIELSPEEVRCIDTTAFQRLRGVKQLGTANLVYPGATHTRFEHSIGTLHLTDRVLDAVNRNAERDPERCVGASPGERRLLRLAALLHDVTHIPYGHNIEDQTGLLPRHDLPARYELALGDTELGAVLEDLGVREDVLAILSGGRGRADGSAGVASAGVASAGVASAGVASPGSEPPAGPRPPFWSQVLSDTIDADLLDYLARDARHTGLELRYDPRVLGYFRVDRQQQRMFVDCEKQGMLREDIVSELIRLLETRYHFSERVYYHHAKIAAGALLARMVEMAMRAGALTAEDLQASTDESLLFQLERADLGDADDNARLRRFVERFRRRALPKRVAVLPIYLNESLQGELLERWFAPGRPEPRFSWEREREAEGRAALGRDVDVLLYCPARRMQLKEARTLVRMPGAEDLQPLSTFSAELPRLRDLEACYPRLWKLYVLTSATGRDERRVLQERVMAALPDGCVNALRL